MCRVQGYDWFLEVPCIPDDYGRVCLRVAGDPVVGPRVHGQPVGRLRNGLVDRLHVAPGVEYFDDLGAEPGDQTGLGVEPRETSAVVADGDLMHWFVREFGLEQIPYNYSVLSPEHISYNHNRLNVIANIAFRLYKMAHMIQIGTRLIKKIKKFS